MSLNGAFSGRIPKKVKENLKLRKLLLERSARDPSLQEELWIACKRDLLFYVNLFCWTYDPRKNPPLIPFVTWEYEDEALVAMEASIREAGLPEASSRDVIIEKSRDMGATWMMMTVFQWRWQFYPLQTFLVASRKEDLVDRMGDPDCLFWKLDFLLENQPSWMRPRFLRTKLQLVNEDNLSTLSGESTNADVGRGGRRTAILIDEAASIPNLMEVDAATADVTRCRFFNSTPKGKNHFYRLRQNPSSRVIRLHWSQHPEKARGLYTSA